MSTEGAIRPTYFARRPLMVAGTIVALVVAGTYTAHRDGAGAMQPTATQVAERTLRFEDRADGAVLVINADTNKTIEVMTGQNGFLRGTLRGFARTRKMDHIGEAEPFQLSSFSDGRLILKDPSTGRYVDIESFGQTNEAVFGHMLSPSLYAS